MAILFIVFFLNYHYFFYFISRAVDGIHSDDKLMMIFIFRKLYIIIKTVTTVKQIPPMFEN